MLRTTPRRLPRAALTALLLLPLLGVLPLLGAGCSSPEPKEEEEKKEPPPPPPPPPPPAKADLLAKASRDVRAGRATPGFNRIYCYQEAIQAYLKVKRFYPEAAEARFAEAEISRLGERVGLLRRWKREIEGLSEELEDARLPLSRMSVIVRRLQSMREDLPAPFIERYVDRAEDKARGALGSSLREEVERIRPAADRAESHGRLADAYALWKDLPEELFGLVEEMDRVRRSHLERLESKAAREAQDERYKAEDALSRGHQRIAMATYKRAWERLRPFRAAADLLRKEYELFRKEARKEIPFASGSLGDLDRRLLGLIEENGNLDLASEGAAGRVEAFLRRYETLRHEYSELVRGGAVSSSEAAARLSVIDRAVARGRELLP